MVAKEVEKLLRGGLNTATVKVSAEVCLLCGERLYSQETVQCFERIREKLKEMMWPAFSPWVSPSAFQAAILRASHKIQSG